MQTFESQNIPRGLPRPTSRRRVLLLALGLVIAIMLLEWFSDLDYSLEVFYTVPVVVAATVMNRWQTIAAAVFCAVVRSIFTPGSGPIEVWLQLAMAVIAYGGIGILTSEMNGNRRAIMAAYARLRMEEDLRRKAEDQLRILVESSPAAILTLNEHGEVLAANRAAHDMLGFPEPGSMLGISLADQVPVFAGALRVSGGGIPMRVSSTSWARRASGAQFPVSVWFSTYEENGQRRLAGILVDTSEEVREREYEMFRHLADSNRLLAGAVAHEIRNLCSAILVVTSNLSRHLPLVGDADYGALKTLTTSLMKIAAFELASKQDRPGARIELDSLLEQLRVVIEPDWEEVGGEILWEPCEQTLEVYADEHALLQVLLNLSQNSLRAVQQGGEAKLAIRVRPNEESATITFEDSGPGIPDASQLFQPFRDHANGTGLGLYVSRAILRGFGGDLIHIPTGAGCRFEIEVPVYMDRSEAGRQHQDAPAAV